jgi:hypothetical protein
MPDRMKVANLARPGLRSVAIWMTKYRSESGRILHCDCDRTMESDSFRAIDGRQIKASTNAVNAQDNAGHQTQLADLDLISFFQPSEGMLSGPVARDVGSRIVRTAGQILLPALLSGSLLVAVKVSAQEVDALINDPTVISNIL